VSTTSWGATDDPCSRLANAIGDGVELVNTRVTLPVCVTSDVTSSETHVPVAKGPEATLGLVANGGAVFQLIACSSQAPEASVTANPLLSPSVA
jgi:hypothetical protein